MKYILYSHLVKCNSKTTWKAKFKFRILRLLRTLHQNVVLKGEQTPSPEPTLLFTTLRSSTHPDRAGLTYTRSRLWPPPPHTVTWPPFGVHNSRDPPLVEWTKVKSCTYPKSRPQLFKKGIPERTRVWMSISLAPTKLLILAGRDKARGGPEQGYLKHGSRVQNPLLMVWGQYWPQTCTSYLGRDFSGLKYCPQIACVEAISTFFRISLPDWLLLI